MSKTKNKTIPDRNANAKWVKANTAHNPTRMEKLKKFASIDYAKKLIFDPQYITPTCYLLLIAELVLNYFIIEYVHYTEIDWRAYMQEVEGFLNGTLDYSLLKGDTGPCVYPAGFIYIYSAFYWVTEQGRNIKLAQYIFVGIYLMQSWLTYRVCMKTSKLPAYALVLSFATSYRIHSIYVLRLFNDPIGVLFFWIALNCFISNRWRWGSLFYSLGVSIKMNILLYAPCLLLAYLGNLTLLEVGLNLAICGVVQVILALPFLLSHPWSYIMASFDLGRIFEYKWTVNYRFLDEEVFVSKSFHVGLLVVHLSLLAVFAPLLWKYFKSYYVLRQSICDMKQQSQQQQKPKQKKTKHVETKKVETKKVEVEPLTKEQQQFIDSFEKQIKSNASKTTDTNKSKAKSKKTKAIKSPPNKTIEVVDSYEINFNKISQLFVLPFFITNFIGIACARSLHYQFYSWYFHSLLYLVFSTPYRKPLGFLLLAVLESCWNIYPSTEWSSASLHVVHVVILYGVYKTMRT